LHSLLFSSLLFSSLLIPFDSALAGVLPDTGQTKCYNNTGEIPCPYPGEAFFGQDGNYQGPQPAYQVSGDGLVVTDLNTGLMWQQADDGVLRDWYAASAYCDNLALSGYSDWRLPSIEELDSIVDFGRFSPAINPAFGGNTWASYLSGSRHANSTNEAWIVEFRDGSMYSKMVIIPCFVRCVRGGQ
jgi:hypothetical protein